MPNIKRLRFDSKGVAVAPTRLLDDGDGWAAARVDVCAAARRAGKAVALHTHFTHPAEISWNTRLAVCCLVVRGVLFWFLFVLLRGVNDHVDTMDGLIRDLADCRVFPVSSPPCR